MRGQVFDIEGKTFWTFGGASSHDIRDGILEIDDPRLRKWRYDYDKMYRVNHISWWKEELPSAKEIEEGRINLENIKISDIKPVNIKNTYSFTSHIAVYENCALQYKFLKELGFSPVRVGATIFGQLYS